MRLKCCIQVYIFSREALLPIQVRKKRFPPHVNVTGFLSMSCFWNKPHAAMILRHQLENVSNRKIGFRNRVKSRKGKEGFAIFFAHIFLSLEHYFYGTTWLFFRDTVWFLRYTQLNVATIQLFRGGDICVNGIRFALTELLMKGACARSKETASRLFAMQKFWAGRFARSLLGRQGAKQLGADCASEGFDKVSVVCGEVGIYFGSVYHDAISMPRVTC